MNNVFTIITGGLGGLGSAFALECAKQRHNILLIDQHLDGDYLINYLRSHFPIDIQYQNCNLSDQDARLKLIENWQEKGLRFDQLINTVGIEIEGNYIERTRAEILSIIHLNIEALVDLTLAVLKQRSEDQRFNLINIASLAGLFPMPYKSVYAASKRFIINFSLSLREEIRDFGNVTVVCPAGLPTTAEAMRKIFLQGFWGKITAQDTDIIVHRSLNKVQHNVAIYIPGTMNKLLVFFSRFLPESWLAVYLAYRWGKRKQGFDYWQITHNQSSK